MEAAERFGVVSELVVRGETLPSWVELGARLEMPDERWQPFDPLHAVADVTSQWTSVPHDWTNVNALWLGLEDDGSRRFVDPVAFADLDANNFPTRVVWRAERWHSQALTEFARLASDSADFGAYDYALPLAWLALLVRHVRPAPPHMTVLAGHGDGDYFVMHG